jgi:hypothetical protein
VAVLVEADEEENPLRGRVAAKLVRSELRFDAEPQRRTFEENEGFLEGVSEGGARAADGAVIERLGATGLWEIASDLVDLAAAVSARRAQAIDRAEGHSPSKKSHRYTALDVHGSRTAVTLEFFS